jgi:two-component system KDP operon response regulator KdpE
LKHVLIVDDDARFRRTLHVALGSLGYEVTDVASGSEALELVKTATPDIALIDWQMPEMDGLQTCHALQAGYRIPVIIISGNRANTRAKAVEAGASELLGKPFSIQDLLATIESTLKC